MKNFTFVCPCIFGLESILTFEIRRIGGRNIRTENGRVLFDGDIEHIALANINLRTAERVLILLSEFKALTFEDLFQGVNKSSFYKYLSVDSAFPVKGWSINSQLRSIPDCQKIIKKSIVENLKKHYDVEWFYETGVKYSVQFSILKDHVSIMIDTSGEGLHKRGYRAISSVAPIKETLAAGIVDLARVKHDSIIYDPMCGSGTILIEAAMKACNIAPGINRKFDAEKFPFIDKNIWDDARKKAVDAINKDATFKAFGCDMDEETLSICEDNIEKAGLSDKIKIEECLLWQFTPKIKDAILITNPPYGERILEVKDARQIYKTLGHLARNNENLKIYTISPEENFEGYFGRNATKRRKLYNGMIKCQLYMYY
ncbi:MAG: THUMP domain-containing class I SAM-dependent RNA methyltransferase [Oscillospiraceae bacterium]